jgi:hypothetical protein
MTHIPGHTDSSSITADDALANLDGNLSGGGLGSPGAYVNQVYLSSKEVPAVKGVVRGKKVDTGKGYQDVTTSIFDAKRMYLTDAELRKSWEAKLRSLGQDANPVQARALWEVAVAGASDWYSTSNGQQKVTPQQYLEWYLGGAKGQGNIPSRQVYMPTTEQIDADISKIAESTLGRTIQDTDKSADWYQDLVKGLNKLYSKGTVTTVQTVTNPKTGKAETVTTTKPKVSTEKVAERITTALEAADPESLARKQRLDGIKWLYSMGGRQR